MTSSEAFVAWFEDLRRSDVPSVGGKNASLGEMVRELGGQGIRVPGGFATVADAYRAFVDLNDLGPVIADRTKAWEAGDAPLPETGAAIRAAFLRARWPDALAEQIRQAYRDLCARPGDGEVDVAVRSSATAEDLPDASFAGQQETFLNVRGESQLLDACRRCYASLFTDRA
ncbi:MAG TPA: PEP/pyruvate-binding domain-containing protein, partial [Methylomirabilota bacterium]|nr:PEP/pyruvate-binding domain-containing protein [Methylomirabilota bacterium]